MTPTAAISVEESDADLLGLAALLKASADPLRLEILKVLERDSFGVLELATIFDVRQPSMSHHLKVLAAAGLLARRREGNAIFYRRHHRAPGAQFHALWSSLMNAVDALPLREDLAARIADIQAERSLSARRFFAANVDRLRANQDLIAEFSQYGPALRDLLEAVRLPGNGLAVEIGPGAGEFLPELAGRFERIVAVDTASEMLDRARALIEETGAANVEFIHGDTTMAAAAMNNVDCIVVNMVLHHNPSPAAIISDCADMLRTGGTLLVTDLCHHDQDWVRQACGDLWLGFDPEDITHWAGRCGLTAGRSLYLALRNGFGLQVRQFIRTAGDPPGETVAD